MAYKTGTDRSQINLYPICLDEAIQPDNVVRVIDAFVDWLDLSELGFEHATDNQRGTSIYPPSMLLKLYLYGYLNRIRSSRRLETECIRNIELHWLLHRMNPAYHTIADFRKNNLMPIKKAFKCFTGFCLEASLIEGKRVGIDGTKIKGQNSSKNNFNQARLEKLLSRIETKTQEYEQYLSELDAMDAQETHVASATGKSRQEVQKALALLKERKEHYGGFQEKLKGLREAGCPTEQLQISTVDPDARSLPFKQNHTEIGYNVQTAGDAKHKLVVHYEVTNVGDTHALAAVAKETKVALGLELADNLDVLADTGYHTGEQLSKCAAEGITTFVCPPEPSRTSTTSQKQTFGKDQFVYDETSNAYTCPNQQKLTTNGTWYEHDAYRKGLPPRKYKQYTLPSNICQQCPFAEQCQGKRRRKQWHGKTIERYEHEGTIEANRKRMENDRTVYQKRKEIIEHPFGTIKRSWGCYYTLLKTKEKVSGEFALVFLCYNLRRVISILGTKGLIDALLKSKPSKSNSSSPVLATFFKNQTFSPNLAVAENRVRYGRTRFLGRFLGISKRKLLFCTI